MTIAARQVDQATADLADSHIGVPTPPGVCDDRDELVVGQREIAVDTIDLFAVGDVPVPSAARAPTRSAASVSIGKGRKEGQRQQSANVSAAFIVNSSRRPMSTPKLDCAMQVHNGLIRRALDQFCDGQAAVHGKDASAQFHENIKDHAAELHRSRSRPHSSVGGRQKPAP